MAYFPEYLGFDMNFDEVDDEIGKFIASSKSGETTRKQDLWAKKLHKFIGDSSIIGRKIEDASKADVNRLFCAFVIDAKKGDGDNYEVNTLRSMFSFLGTYAKQIKKGDVDSDQEYQGFRDVKKAKMKVVKCDGKGNQPNKSSHLTREEEERMYTTGQFGYETPGALQRTMWWHTTVLFGHRGRQESRQMCWGDVTLKQDDKGGEYLEFQERLTKTRSGGAASDSRSFAPKAWKNEENPARCPVECYKRFAAHRPESMTKDNSPFYLVIKHNRRHDDPVWFCNTPLGKNSLSSMMKSGCEKAGITGRKTNHSARKTCVKRALDAGCPREYVAQLTGHKSVTSLENYTEADIHVQRAMCGSVMRGVSFNAASTSGAGKLEETVTTQAATFVVNISHCQNVNITTSK